MIRRPVTATRSVPGGPGTTVAYDQAGRVQRTTVAGSLPVAYTYGAQDWLAGVTIGTGPEALDLELRVYRAHHRRHRSRRWRATP